LRDCTIGGGIMIPFLTLWGGREIFWMHGGVMGYTF
jgi:hypothetical protein